MTEKHRGKKCFSAHRSAGGKKGRRGESTEGILEKFSGANICLRFCLSVSQLSQSDERERERESAVTSEHWISRERETRWVGLG